MKLRASMNINMNASASVPFTADEWIEVKDAVAIGRRLTQSPYVSGLEFEDEKGSFWTLKELEKLKEELAHEPDEITVFFDGSYDKESELAGLGIVIYYSLGGERYRLRKNKSFRLTTNNEAEYAALHEAVNELRDLGASRNSVIIKGDSLVVLNQLEGNWPCYDPVHSKWLDRIEKQLEKLKLSPTYIQISRKDNKEADQLAKKMLEHTIVESHTKLDK
ncbi:reverse transcriptase-like protein [Bacillus sonorensis]|nr:reverse transcriptase-like protein [Bacillus sonorensis]MCY8035994.1 reverse transcriptase-like protein [Bacillus sonorensis]MCY8564963.1 reverse transcriptase-like protein [Bacillus sonorensis]MEC1503323.1 reverse transcriptase-like protein [Bacillus sonorensis]MEC1536280.1 reverse transcriptase-like protein [Bacillus sonorensis]